MQKLPSLALLVLLTGQAMGNPTISFRGNAEKAERDNQSSSSTSSDSSTSLAPSMASTPSSTSSYSTTTIESESTGTVSSTYTSDISTSSSIDISSLLSSLSNDIQTTQSTSATSLDSISTTLAGSPESTTATAASSTSTSDPSISQSSSSKHHRDLMIALSTILSFLGLIVLILLIYLIRRSQRSKTRPSTPISDNEIAQWRGTSKLPLTRPPGTPQSQHQRYHSFGEKTPLRDLPTSPTLARAPNSRTGLTDETVPGDAPFVGKKRASKLSKHTYGASVSKSVRSTEERPSTWYDDDAVLQRSSRPKGADKEDYD